EDHGTDDQRPLPREIDDADQDSGRQRQLYPELRENPDKGGQREEDKDDDDPGRDHQDDGWINHRGLNPARRIQVPPQLSRQLRQRGLQVTGELRDANQVDVERGENLGMFEQCLREVLAALEIVEDRQDDALEQG